MITKVHIYTDGSVYPGNPGTRNGWCAVLIHGKNCKLISGALEEKRATNNRAEVLAVVHGLNALKYPCEAVIHTDSMYVIRAIASLQNGRKLKKNLDILDQLSEAMRRHKVSTIFVKGHNGNQGNVQADKHASEAAKTGEGTQFSWVRE